MYPTISDFINDLFGFYFPLPIQTFGFFMAMSFAGAYHFTTKELNRKTAEGLLLRISRTVVKNKAIGIQDYTLNAISYGLIGFKVLEMFLDYEALTANPQAFILSLKGSIAGLLIGIGAGIYITYREAQAVKGKEEETVIEDVPASALMWNITAIAGISGILGAKIFHNLEYPNELIEDPIGALLSFSGLTFYGGLIVATVAVLYYTNKNKIPTLHMIDAAAPGLMLAYGIGRIGCQLSGDGDWGIVNLAPKPEWLSFFPDWVWGFQYPNNVLGEGIPIPGCEGQHCFMLPQPVFPTPFYEVIMAFLLFAGLWTVRKKIKAPGVLFAVYLIVNGIERFTIEKIRVNATYHIGNLEITQAEIISTILIIIGLSLIVILQKRHAKSLT